MGVKYGCLSVSECGVFRNVTRHLKGKSHNLSQLQIPTTVLLSYVLS
jgi:hypothetical protein